MTVIHSFVNGMSEKKKTKCVSRYVFRFVDIFFCFVFVNA